MTTTRTDDAIKTLADRNAERLGHMNATLTDLYATANASAKHLTTVESLQGALRELAAKALAARNADDARRDAAFEAARAMLADH